MDKWDCMKLKSFCTTKIMLFKLKRAPTDWEKKFTGYTLDKALITIQRAQRITPPKSVNQ
jgi:hypothetical protein